MSEQNEQTFMIAISRAVQWQSGFAVSLKMRITGRTQHSPASCSPEEFSLVSLSN